MLGEAYTPDDEEDSAAATVGCTGYMRGVFEAIVYSLLCTGLPLLPEASPTSLVSCGRVWDPVRLARPLCTVSLPNPLAAALLLSPAAHAVVLPCRSARCGPTRRGTASRCPRRWRATGCCWRALMPPVSVIMLLLL